LSFSPKALLNTDESRTDPERKAAVEDLLGPVSDRQFHDLVEIGKRITDYHDVGGRDEGADAVLGENIPVVFEDDEGENQAEGFEIKDASEDASDEGEETGMTTALGGKVRVVKEKKQSKNKSRKKGCFVLKS
jgi:hypothetical protein